jgi:hypothetical protein
MIDLDGWIGEKPPSDYRLGAYLLMGMVPDLLVLIVWTAAYPFYTDSAAAGLCDSQYADIFVALLFCFKVPAGLACLYFGYSLRKLHDVSSNQPGHPCTSILLLLRCLICYCSIGI